jgi:poly(3-hydroxybutyrate) depolymerase
MSSSGGAFAAGAVAPPPELAAESGGANSGAGGATAIASAAGSGQAGTGVIPASGAGASSGSAADSGGTSAPAGSGASGVAATGGAGATSDVKCGTRSGMRGKTMRTLTVGTDKRTYIAYLPEDADPSRAMPFVYVFHGANQTGQNLYDMTTYATLAKTERIAVVFPDGQGASSASSVGSLTPWSVTDGGPVCGAGTLVSNPNPVDFAFMDAIKLDVQQDQCLDSKHVYSTGFSMGGYMTHHIACDRTDIRAAAPHSGGTLAELSTCKTGHVPIIIFHGTADPLIAANCDDPKLTPDPSFVASATLWAKKNGCQTTFTTIDTNGTNGGKGSCYLYDGCPPDGQVEMCSFQDLPHAWAGAPVCPSCIGEGPSYASATQLQWDFFKKYAW